MPRTIVTIGASAGGVEALTALLSLLPIDLPAAVVVVLHRSPTHIGALEKVLGRRALIRVAAAVDGEPIEPGRVYIAPANAHVLVEPGRLRLHHGPKVHFTRPAVDCLWCNTRVRRPFPRCPSARSCSTTWTPFCRSTASPQPS